MSQILEEIFEEVRFPVEVPRLQVNDLVVDFPVPMVQTVLKTVEAPRLHFIDVVGAILFGADADPQAGPVSCEFQQVIISCRDDFLLGTKS